MRSNQPSLLMMVVIAFLAGTFIGAFTGVALHDSSARKRELKQLHEVEVARNNEIRNRYIRLTNPNLPISTTRTYDEMVAELTRLEDENQARFIESVKNPESRVLDSEARYEWNKLKLMEHQQNRISRGLGPDLEWQAE